MSPKLGNKYHCYCPCGGCENFDHCRKGLCDAPEPMTPEEVKRMRLFANSVKVGVSRPISEDEKALLTGYRSRASLSEMAEVPPNPGDVKMLIDGKFQWVSPEDRYRNLPKHDYAYLPVDQDGNVGSLVPAREPADSDESRDPLREPTREQRIEDMIDWMEANGMPLEPWQANSLRAILMADLPVKFKSWRRY